MFAVVDDEVVVAIDPTTKQFEFSGTIKANEGIIKCSLFTPFTFIDDFTMPAQDTKGMCGSYYIGATIQKYISSMEPFRVSKGHNGLTYKLQFHIIHNDSLTNRFTLDYGSHANIYTNFTANGIDGEYRKLIIKKTCVVSLIVVPKFFDGTVMEVMNVWIENYDAECMSLSN